MSGAERLPLAGRRIVVTRPRAQAGRLVDGLRAAGAEPVLLPVVRIAPPTHPAALMAAAQEAAEYDWIVFTSVNSVEALLGSRRELGLHPGELEQVKVAAIGVPTAEAAAAWGVGVDLVPGEFASGALVEALEREGLRGLRVLIPRSEQGRAPLAAALRAAGAEVNEVKAYQTKEAPLEPDRVREALAGGVDGLTFTSPSTVTGFRSAHGRAGLRWPPSAPAFCIGRVTGEAAERQGLRVAGIARPHTVEGLLEAVTSHFRNGG